MDDEPGEKAIGNAGSKAGKDWIYVIDDFLLTADHQAISALASDNPAAGSDIPYPVKTSSKMDDSRKPAHPSCLQ